MAPTDPSADAPGPAEAARRALREARERAGATPEPEGAGEGEGAGAEHEPVEQAPAMDPAQPPVRREDPEQPEQPVPSGPRPGDAARAALRRAVAQRRTAARTDDQATEPPAPDETPPDTAPAPAGTQPGDTAPAASGTHSGDTASVPRGTRSGDSAPADRAREALRAARAEAQRKAADAAETSTARRRPPRSAAPPATRHPGPSRGDLARERALDVRNFLAGAFRMPSDPAPGEPDDEDSGWTGQDSGHPEQPARPQPVLPASDTPTHPAPPDPPGPASHVPRSMAAPARDGDLRRTFPAFAPGPAGEGSRFAETWWGNAWITALEEGALDPKRLARGRGYAEQGHVDAITVTPGSVLAYVRGSRPRPYRVQVRLRTLDDADWARFLDAAAERPGHIAALLDKEMPHSLADCGVRLLPGPGDLEPRCSCPDRGHPCKHAAALCYQTARLLDEDPFVLLLLRGRGERQLLDTLARLSATRAARAAQDREPAPLPGVRATEALAPRRLPPLPEPLPLPAHPEQPPVYPAAPGGPDPIALDQLATDAAARAHALLATGRDEVGELTLWQDAIRLAAARPGSGLTAGSRALYSSLASAAGRSPAELARAVAAWRQGGRDGLAVLEEPWDPPAGRFDRARPALLAADLPAFRPWRNRLTHPRGHVQLRLGRDGLWYAYESEPGADDWWPRGTPDPDPVGALTGLGITEEL
ncbi:hypothetical protein C3489_24010 [Streptomyces sp. Ru71]|uniref:SWIM zinc finger family protein n=1 Tax=Streptomyces sp. Ru71 TaxID=2080746 RepID=UPI000CDDDBE9|nr:SWIM zinc finger family protein [Streptomyces sp. Ru71]POX49786.1 hypothetical protein C3489_24010 [Streptomyces sp. Ru71]